MTSPNGKEGEVLGAERRRRWSTAEKLAIVRGLRAGNDRIAGGAQM